MAGEKKVKKQESIREPAPVPDTGPGQNFSVTAGTAEDRKLRIERGVEDIFSKFESEPAPRNKPPSIIEDPIGIKIELLNNKEAGPDEDAADKKTGTGGDTRRPSRNIFALGGLSLVLAAGIVFFIFQAVEKRVRMQSSKIVTTQKINRPASSPPEKVPLEKTTLTTRNAVSQNNEIKAFLTRWKTAWENTAGKQADMDNYMSFYADSFTSKGMNKTAWRLDKIKKNSRKDWIRLQLKDIHIDGPGSGDQIEIGLLLVYNSSNYSDKTRKVLTLQKEGPGFKITGIKTVD